MNDYIEHHGIKGQKHGVRNGPPYPLKPSEHSASEKKAGWRSSLSGGDEKSRKKVAKDASRYLNAIDKKTAFEGRFASDRNKQVERITKKISKYNKKATKATKKALKYNKKVAKLEAQRKKLQKLSQEHMSNIKHNEAATKDICGYLEKQGYKINRKATIRNVNTKAEIALNILSIATTGYGVVNYAHGTKYKVK